MRSLIAVATAALLTLPTISRADGLIYQLPPDGTVAEYDLKLTRDRNGDEMVMEGTFSIKSVGKQTVDDVACRWIEFRMMLKMGERERVMRGKVLVPESELARGKSPVAHVKKAWFRRGDGEPQDITGLDSPNAGPIPAFLSGPFQDEEKLQAEVVASGLGKLECEGVSGSSTYKLGDLKNIITFKNRLHAKASFGVVSSEMRVQTGVGDTQRDGGTMSLMLKKVGKDAKSEISTPMD